MKQQGFFLIEVIIVASVVAAVLMFLLGSIQNSVEAAQRSLERTQAAYLLEEGAEAVRLIRDTSWDTIAALTEGVPYYLLWNGSAWSLTTTPSSSGAMTRTIVFASVSRTAEDDIATSGGTIDTGTKQGTVVVSWPVPGGTASETLTLYISNIR